MTPRRRSAPLHCILLAGWALLQGSGCQSPEPARQREFPFELHARSDDGEALRGVTVRRGSLSLGSTDESGRLVTQLRGSEGQVVSLSVECPAAYQPLTAALSARLSSARGVGKSTVQPSRLSTVCQRLHRKVVLVVHAQDGAGLPVKVNGEVIGTTDLDGNAHMLLTAARDVRTLDVELDARSRKDLVGQNSRRLLELGQGDTVLLVEHAFRRARVTQRAAPATAPQRHVPTRID
jgi:hypothetical protein